RGLRHARRGDGCLALHLRWRRLAGSPADGLRFPGLSRVGRRDAPRRSAMDPLKERARPRWGRLLKRVIAIVVGAAAAIVVLLLLVSADARYVARAGVEEARILLRRRSIEKLLADTSVRPALRQRLRLVLEARRF